ncbi:hypothetical protein JMJ77_0014258 [Colletotrichum scovillei]|uniref:Uncharacterized protein n=1 Tax=Colletotrichum scovillei TaxID=1209932 RepID=A0A9P7R330_9PEZI|nr:hypothetical protein JMJ77_0014258 [Colletotrichum scovillei]KAG7065810.1 hypothetical protein JMJ78_0012556 [Colletotrichum scovillei]KAG7068386.1 hypothetical protein JMJ76_0008076 [Colletotrichum scovillei]
MIISQYMIDVSWLS